MSDLPIWGFTGSRLEPSKQQIEWLSKQFDRRVEFHHGACVGADAAAHAIAKAADARIVVHPPIDEKLMMPRDHTVVYRRAKAYLTRNRDIVNDSERMLALPNGPRRYPSGTWYTIEYALEHGIPVTMCYPDGTVETPYVVEVPR